MLQRQPVELCLVSVNVAMFSYEPVLRRLQAMPAVLFAELDHDGTPRDEPRPLECAFAERFAAKASEYVRASPAKLTRV